MPEREVVTIEKSKEGHSKRVTIKDSNMTICRKAIASTKTANMILRLRIFICLWKILRCKNLQNVLSVMLCSR